jgi:molybdopterin-biosynthesis enzyme MoeA-like protein
MAKIPAPARLVAQPGWPALRLDVNHAGRDARIYILPGVPSLFRSKMSALEAIAGELPHFNAWEVVTIDTERDESEFAADLREVAERFPEVEIGSYPTWQPGADGRLSVKVRLTFEAQQPGSARAAAQTFSERLTLRGTCDTAPP